MANKSQVKKSGSKSVMTAAYIKVNGITRTKANSPEVQEIISGAAVRVWSYQGLYEGESEELRERRLDIDGVADGEVYELAKYFKELDSSLSGQTDWAVVFIMLNKLDSLEGNTKEDESVATDAESAVDAEEPEQLSTNTVNKNNDSKMEEKDMGNQSDAFNKLANEIEQNSKAGTAAKPRTVSDAVKDATREILEATRVTRKSNTVNTTFEKIILSKRPLKERLVAGENSTGRVSKPTETLAKFMKKLNIEVAEDGTISSPRLVSGEEDNLQQVYDALTKAVNDETYELPVYIGDSLGTGKGGFVKKADGKSVPMKNDEISNFLYTETLGAFNGPGDVVVHIATARGLDKPETTLIEKKIRSKGAEAVVTLKISNRKSMLENPALVSYYQDIVKDTKEETPGAKSVLSVKYVTDNLASDGVTKKTATYRIPLITEQYKSQVTDKVLLDAWGEPTRGGNQVSYDLSNENDLEKLFGVVANVVNEMVIHNVTGVAIVDESRAKAASIEAADQEEASESFAGV